MGEIIAMMMHRFPAERTGPIIVHPEVHHASSHITDNTVTATQKYSHCWPVITYSAPRKHHFVFKLLNPLILCGNRLFEPNNLVLKPGNLSEDFTSMTTEQLHLLEAQFSSSWRVLLRPVFALSKGLNTGPTGSTGFTFRKRVYRTMYHTLP